MPESDRIRIPDRIRRAVTDHALRCHPLEACGLIAANSSGDLEEFFPIRNIDESSERFTLEPEGQYAAFTAANDRGWSIWGVMHSHVVADASPSQIDLAQPHDPEWHHIIVGFEPEPHIRVWRMIEGVPIEMNVAYG